MQFIDIPTEQTTAITDILLAVGALYVVNSIYRTGKKVDVIKTYIWVGAFALLFFAAVLGSIAHGIMMSPFINYIIWQPLNLFLGLAIALFAVGVIYDWNNFNLSRKLFVFLMVTGIIFYSITIVIPESFVIFILYEAVAMLFSLVLYALLWTRKKFPGSPYMVIGIIITVIAALVQANDNFYLKIIWEFDHNGLFHLIQIPGILFLKQGLNIELKSRMA
jgi:hypothetical protein